MRLIEAVRQRFDVATEIGDEFLVRCPEHDDRRPSASVNVKKGLWTCYACGAGGKVSDYLNGLHVTDEPDTEELLNDLERDVGLLDQMMISHYPESWLDQFETREALFYWQDTRGLSGDSVDRFRLGFDEERNTPTYPLRSPDGKVLGVVRRRRWQGQRDLKGDLFPKYKYPSHVDVSECLFGYELLKEHPTKHLVITEGALDAIAFWEVGIPAVGQYGIMLRPGQIELLKRLGLISITLVYDNDDEGKHSVLRTLEGYQDRKGRHHPPLPLDFVIVKVASWEYHLGNDPLDLGRDARRRLVNEAKVWPTYI